jgi:hypothetical protein
MAGIRRMIVVALPARKSREGILIDELNIPPTSVMNAFIGFMLGTYQHTFAHSEKFCRDFRDPAISTSVILREESGRKKSQELHRLLRVLSV